MGKSFAYLLLLFAVTFMGCNGWDDDSEYVIGTQAAFFLSPAPTQGLQLIRVPANGFETEWNSQFGMSNADLSDVDFRENMLWMSSGNGKLILEVSPIDEVVTRRFENLPIAPHIFSVGREQILIADTVSREVAFIKIKNRESVVVRQQIDARMCIYNSGRFYLVHGQDSVSIYDEKALHPRGYGVTGTYIDDIMFDRYYNIRVASHDSIRTYVAIISGNGNYLAEPNYPVDMQKIQYTPYFFARFGTEIIDDLQLTDHVLKNTLLEPLLDSLDNFETDFFDGVVYGTWQDSLIRYDYAKDSVLSREYFPHEILKGFFQYGNAR